MTKDYDTQQEKIKEIESLMEKILGDFDGTSYMFGDGRWIEIRTKFRGLKNDII